MTKQEAIDVLQNTIVRFGRNSGKTVYAEALNMAIEALSCSEKPNKSDIISRQEAIEEFDRCEYTLDGGIDANYAIDFLKQMPSAQPKTGKWVMKMDSATYWIECSECGCRPLLNRYNHSTEESNFCPNCGADMRGGADGE